MQLLNKKMKPYNYLLCAFLFFNGFLQSCSSLEDARATPIATLVDDFQPVATADIVMYEINTSAFSSSKNLQGITNRLDAIKALGINTIWIMPIYQVGVLNAYGSPYCVKNYTTVNSNLGTLNDIKNLVIQAHKRKIAVILDWVANHTSWDNSWISNNPNWYTHNASGQIISPAGTNWNDVADLNYTVIPMRLAMIEAMKYWVINANIDGFRCDAADFVPFDFWVQAISALNATTNKPLILLAEGARADHFTAGFQMNFAWDYLGIVKNVFGLSHANVANLFTTNTAEYSVVPSGKEKLRFITNHDESNQFSPITVYQGINGALAAAVCTVFLQGVPLLYCGQEVGVANTATYNGNNTIDWTANPELLLAYQKILQVYNTNETARKGVCTTFSDPNVVVFKKSTPLEEILVIVNSRFSIHNLAVPLTLQGIWTNAVTNETVTLSESLFLTGFNYLILKKQR